jgi:hypothetical protein
VRWDSVAPVPRKANEGILIGSDVVLLVDALYVGLEDYTTDQRGDVGSWVRVSCCKALGRLRKARTACASETWELVVSRLLRLAVEKLEVVRQAALFALAELVPNLAPQSWAKELTERMSVTRRDALRFVAELMPVLWPSELQYTTEKTCKWCLPPSRLC